MPTTDVGIGGGTYDPGKVAQAKSFVKAGAGETKFGMAAGGNSGMGPATLGAIQEDEAALQTGFILSDWDPVLMQILSGDI